MRRRQFQLNRRGDTLVEVLIAIAIVSTVLAGAFNVTQKSTLAVRDSQERGEMLQILQGQVELVRANAIAQSDTSSGVYSAGGYFCMDPATKAMVPMGGVNLANLGSFTGVCRNMGSRYSVAINYNSGSNTFTFFGRWDMVGGGTGSMQMSYRVNPGS
jgi:prepilin-type N-terminal cleavage/methylation domain-containing protein